MAAAGRGATAPAARHDRRHTASDRERTEPVHLAMPSAIWDLAVSSNTERRKTDDDARRAGDTVPQSSMFGTPTYAAAQRPAAQTQEIPNKGGHTPGFKILKAIT